MTNPLSHRLSRRERQIMDVIYSLGQASCAQVMDALPDPPGYSSVRKLIAILEGKGYLCHTREGQHYVYRPTQPRQNAARSAMKQVLHTFFGGNLGMAVETLLSEAETRLTDDDVARLSAMIGEAAGRDKRARSEEDKRE